MIYNPKKFEALGVKLTVRWNAPNGGGYGAYWLDPKGPKFGPAAAYLQHNVAEAKKLLAAAGFEKGCELASHHIVTFDYGREFPKQIETLFGMAEDAGFKIRTEASDFNTSWRPL